LNHSELVTNRLDIYTVIETLDLASNRLGVADLTRLTDIVPAKRMYGKATIAARCAARTNLASGGYSPSWLVAQDTTQSS